MQLGQPKLTRVQVWDEWSWHQPTKMAPDLNSSNTSVLRQQGKQKTLVFEYIEIKRGNYKKKKKNQQQQQKKTICKLSETFYPSISEQKQEGLISSRLAWHTLRDPVSEKFCQGLGCVLAVEHLSDMYKALLLPSPRTTHIQRYLKSHEIDIFVNITGAPPVEIYCPAHTGCSLQSSSGCKASEQGAVPAG